jgi:hypothetical protein
VGGGFSPGVRNVISANGDDGIFVTGGQLNHIEGNYIGTNAAGTAALGNSGAGIALDGTTLQTVGGGLAGARNLISGNARQAVLAEDVTDSLIAGNLMGTDATGLLPMGNGDEAVLLLRSDRNTIGGTLPTQRNVMSANFGGIALNGSNANIIQGNRIGTKADGSGDLGNTFEGIHLVLSDNNVIGGTGATGNVIANTNAQGILVGLDSTGNTIQGNSIAGNSEEGVLVTAGPNKIVSNIIVGNGKEGVKVSVASPVVVGVRISSNQMLSNGKLGINLEGLGENSFGVTANDSGDGDTGANHSQNFPVLTSAIRQPNGVTVVSASLNSTASTAFHIELFLALADPSGHGEGQMMLAAQNFMTNSSGNKTFTFQVITAAPGLKLTATANNQSTDDTSEFSANVTVFAAP